MMLIWGLSSGRMKLQHTQKITEEEENTEEQKKSCWNINTKIQIKMGGGGLTKRMRETNYERPKMNISETR